MITTTPHYSPASRRAPLLMKDNKHYPVWKLVVLSLLALPGVLLLSLAGCLGLLLFLVCLPLALKEEHQQLPPRRQRRFP